MIVMHMSGAYTPQNFYGENDILVDCRDISGTKCYCDEMAKNLLRERVAKLSYDDIHFLDSGNYHYLSLLWLEKLCQPFSLVLFDHHPDMQPPSFGDITSCGGWVKEALDRNPNLKHVYMVGVNPTLMEELDIDDSRVHMGLDELSADQYPIYISFDKDVLSEGDARCDWDQGEITLDDALGMLHKIAEKHKILGMDVCGEDSNWETAFDSLDIMKINEATNVRLHEFWQNKK